MTQRINITLESGMKDEAVILAKSMGLSLSSLIRYLLSEKLENKKLQVVNKILSDNDGDVRCSGEDFLKEIKGMIDSA